MHIGGWAPRGRYCKMINRKEVDKMYKTKPNAEIGNYLSRLIREIQFSAAVLYSVPQGV